MGDWTPSSPKVIPTEWRPRSSRIVAINGPGAALAQRVRPGAVTISHAHLYCGRGGSPLAIEIVNSLAPTETINGPYAVVTDVTGTADWTRSTGAGTWSSHVNGTTPGAYLFAAGSSVLTFTGRASAAALSSKRIRYVEVAVTAASAGTAFQSQIQPVLIIGGVTYEGSAIIPLNDPATSVATTRWYTNPATGKPWTLTEANSFLTAGANSFGFRKPSAGTWIVNASYCTVTIGAATENRMGSFYSDTIGSDVATGWKKYALSSTSALSANTWYWVVAWSYAPGSIGGVLVPVLRFPETNPAATASASIGEHRQVSSLVVDTGGEVVTSSTAAGEIFPVLLDSAGTIRSQSAPYAATVAVPVSSGVPAAQLGQEVTTTGASTPYGAVRIACGYQTAGVTPDAPLLVKVRTTSFTGTVQATATISPLDMPGAGLQDVQQDFDVVYTPPTSTKIFVTVESAASAAAGWQVVLGDQGTDLLTTTTAAEVQGAGFGGTTDAASPASSTRDQRYDLAVALVSAPTAPAGFTATPAVAA